MKRPSVVDRLIAGKKVPFVVVIQTNDAEKTYELVRMTDDQAKALAKALHAGKAAKRLMGYDVSLFIDGPQDGVRYAAMMTEWLAGK